MLGALAGAGTLLAGHARAQSDELTTNTLMGVPLEPFVDPLPIPHVLPAPKAQEGSGQVYRITLSEFYQKLHRDLPATRVWGFAGTMPGPTIAARRGCPVTVHWINRLPTKHRLLIDTTLDGAGKDVPEVRTVIHLHGGHVAAKDDGYPEDWITPGHEQQTFYPNRQPAATLWYHDHAMGITRLNAMMGLAGLYLLRDPEEEQLRLPAGNYEIPIILQDRILDARGQLAYPVGPNPDAPWVPEFFGTQLLANGRVSPYIDVEPRLYRLRLLNASNSRIFQLACVPDLPFLQIGSDGGLLSEPVVRRELLLAPSERLDVVLDFRGREGRRVLLANSARAPYPSGGSPVPGSVLQFRVRRPLEAVAGINEVPSSLCRVSRLEEKAATKTRRLTLEEVMGADKRLHRTLLNGQRFMDPVTEDPVKGSIEIWEFINTTIDTHPIHLHAVHFQLLDRHPFDVQRQHRTSEVVPIGRRMPAAPEEQGWKDTILCPPGQVTRIIAPFSGEPGRYVWHCHMLEHEDNEMMRPYVLRS
jgi:spore coat protein A, manganese oxidase